MVECKTGQIQRDAYCAGDPGTSYNIKSACKLAFEKNGKDACAKMDACHYVPPKCVKDTGKPGSTPASKQWSKDIKIKEGALKKYFPGGNVKYTRDACQAAGNGMQADGVKLATAVRRVNFAINIAPWSDTLKDSRRERCLSGIRSAFSK